tara:strand:- start:6027 stop:6623 length:597 start_codon:yes stop_codon:yes gene_type:complete
MSLDSWEDLQQIWLTDVQTDALLQETLQQDTEKLHRTITFSIARSYGFSLLSLLGGGYVVWELSDALTIPHLTPLLIGLVMAGYIGLAFWKIYLRLSYARGLSLTVCDHVEFMMRRAVSRTRLASATLATMGFSALVILGLIFNELRFQATETFFTPERLAGFSLLFTIIASISAFVFWRRRVAVREVRTLQDLDHQT